MTTQLTRHRPGSVKEVWTLSLPMILSLLTTSTMMFADRLFLAHYATAAMNAITAASLVIIVIVVSLEVITAIAEVFVGQFNGAKEYKRAGSPAWQMLWFSITTPLLFIPLALWAGPYLLPSYHYADYGLPYFQWLLYFALCVPAVGALAGFFVGIGKVRLVLFMAIFSNIINLILDPILIFGVEGLCPAMGAKGAAIATGIAQAVHLIGLLIVFLRPYYQKTYGTSKWRLELPLFLRCLKVGVPSAVGHTIEWAAWALTIQMMAGISELHLTVAAIGQSFYMLVSFCFEGIQKAVTTLAANNIGAKLYANVWKVWRSAMKLLCYFAVPFGVLLLGFPQVLAGQFLTDIPASAELSFTIRITALGVWVYFLLDGFTWISVGLLSAAEDTKYVMWMSSLTAWVFGCLPVYLFMSLLAYPPAFYWGLICFYGVTNALALIYRLRQEPWLRLTLYSSDPANN